MRLWTRTMPVMLSMVGLLIVAGVHTGCGGGSSDNTRRESNAPVVSAITWSPTATTLQRFRPYTFQVAATDPDIGDTIAVYEWDFGDGTSIQQTTVPTCSHIYATANTTGFALKVRAKDKGGNIGAWFQKAVPVDSSESPLTVTQVEPTSAPTLAVDLGGSLQATYRVKVVDASTGVGTPGGPTIDLNACVVDPGETGATVVARRDNLDGTYSFTIQYLGGSTLGSRTVTPKVQMVNSAKLASDYLSLSVLTIVTKDPATNHAPTIVVTSPSGPRTDAFTSKPVDLVFTVADADGDPLSYTVDWGDGTAPSYGNFSGDTKAGASVTTSHRFSDSFTTTTREATAKLTVTDNRQSGTAATQIRTYVVAFNALPTVTITSPQTSATAPSPGELPSGAVAGLVNPAGAQDPDFTVIPVDGKLAFASKATPPGSGDAALTYAWTFEGGVPATSTVAAPGEVQFPIQKAGAIEPHLVTVTVTDAYGRSSLAAAPNPKTYKKWIVVDGRNTQDFTLQFMYRLKTEDLMTGALVSSLSPAVTAANGLGATVKIFQDGAVSTYPVQNQKGEAVAAIPVRSNLPFYVSIPGFGTDTFTYMFRVPNAPAPLSVYADPDLGLRKPAADDPRATASGFWFQNPDAGSAPWNPVLQVVTGQGFGPEVSTTEPRYRRAKGTFGAGFVVGDVPDNTHWIDMLTHPQADAIQSLLSNSVVGEFSISALQAHGEWLMGLQAYKAEQISPAEPTVDKDSVSPTPGELGFVLDYTKLTTDDAKNESYAAFGMQATRIPPHTADPFTVNWNVPSAVVASDLTFAPDPADPTKTLVTVDSTTGLAPKALDATQTQFLQDSLWGDPGSTPLAGGLGFYDRPFERNYPGLPLVAPPFPRVRQGGLRETFSYAEYLWSAHWAHPVVLNRASVNYLQVGALNVFPHFRNSSTNRWPSQASITGGALERTTSIDVAPSGGGTFEPAIGSPVALNGSAPVAGGVGRFYWTAATPELAGMGAISRTWLSDATQQFPTAFNGTSEDATCAYGLFPPQEIVVDKRGRDAKGNLTGGLLDGYRITWYNPTLTAGTRVVAPDFYVVEVQQTGGVYHYLLPANFPGGNQTLGDPIVTDARTYLPSGNAWGTPNLPNPGSPADAVNDQAAPGFCWFDVPKDLQPIALGMDPKSDVKITVFAVKAILRNNAPKNARKLTRVEWLESIKTVTANIKMSVNAGDFSYAHKLPFNYCWDIVVAQSDSVVVKP